MEAVYRARGWVASGPSLLLLAMAVLLSVTQLPKPIKPPHHEAPMRVSLAPPPPAPPVQPLAPQTPVLPEVEQVAPPIPEIPLPSPLKPRVAQKPVTPQAPTPVATPTPANPAPAVAAPVPAPPSPPPVANSDSTYSAQVKAYLESIKHYPTSKEARLQRPRGDVEVWFVLDRGGSLKDAGVENSSGSLILDGAALSLVRSASYPTFPSDAFQGQSTRRFTVHLNYSLT